MALPSNPPCVQIRVSEVRRGDSWDAGAHMYDVFDQATKCGLLTPA